METRDSLPRSQEPIAGPSLSQINPVHIVILSFLKELPYTSLRLRTVFLRMAEIKYFIFGRLRSRSYLILFHNQGLLMWPIAITSLSILVRKTPFKCRISPNIMLPLILSTKEPDLFLTELNIIRLLAFWTLCIVQFFLRHNVSETGICLHPQEESLLGWAQSIELVPISGPKLNMPFSSEGYCS
jgi:hypothetical protein